MVTFNHHNQTVTVNRLCIVTKKPYEVTVPMKGYNSWISGMLIQNAFPELSLEDREFLISSTSPEGWAILFEDEEKPDKYEDEHFEHDDIELNENGDPI